MDLGMTNRKRRQNLDFSNQEVGVYNFKRDRIVCEIDFVHIDFGHIIGQNSYTRASDTLMINAQGIYCTFPTNAPALTNLGMKISPTVTNLAPSTGLQGAVVGEVTNGGVGRLPTGWDYPADYVDQVFVVAIGSERGLPTIDIRIILTAVGTQYPYITMGSTAVGVTGETYTASLYRKTINGTPDISDLETSFVQVIETSAIDGSISHSKQQVFLTETPELSRYTTTYQLTKTVEIEQTIRSFYASVLDGESIDTTVRFAAPQIEIGAYASDPVITEEGVTNVSDEITIYDDVNEYDLSEGVVSFRYYHSASATARNVRLLSLRKTLSHLLLYTSSNNKINIFCNLNGDDSYGSNSFYLTEGYHNILLKWQGTTAKLFVDGALVSTATITPLSDGDIEKLYFGSDGSGHTTGYYTNSVLSDVAFTDEKCVELTL